MSHDLAQIAAQRDHANAMMAQFQAANTDWSAYQQAPAEMLNRWTANANQYMANAITCPHWHYGRLPDDIQ